MQPSGRAADLPPRPLALCERCAGPYPCSPCTPDPGVVGMAVSSDRIAGAELRVLKALRRDGLLIFSDARLPSVVSVISGSPPKGSWFVHPLSHLIFAVAESLERSPEVLSVPLLRRKSTLVHRRLWPALVSAATAHEQWQMDGLSKAQTVLLQRVERRGRVNVQNEGQGIPLPRGRTTGDLARSLEHRLLVIGYSVHSASGRHEKVLESWGAWKRARAGSLPAVTPRAARSSLERAAIRCLGPDLPSRLFPWPQSG